MKKIVLALGILVILCVIGLSYVFAEVDMSSYNIVFNIDNNKEVFGDGSDTIESIDIYIDGRRLEGQFFDSPSCVAGSKLSSSCEMAQIIQNEKIIKQNYEIISLLKEIKDGR